MKRSEINNLIRDARLFFDSMNFKLPPWAYLRPEDWKRLSDSHREIIENKLGWDLTDFGCGDFNKLGLILFTIRNGSTKTGKVYAEKIMIVDELQETPLHFHKVKMEDIINRGGGNLIMELFNSSNDRSLSDTIVEIKVDGVHRKARPGEKVILTPGESICLVPGLYHRFYGEQGKGRVLVGEVSSVNDDVSDNYFYEPLGRFPEITEDEEPLHLIVNDYSRYVNS